jgi:hypothetical protein
MDKNLNAQNGSNLYIYIYIYIDFTQLQRINRIATEANTGRGSCKYDDGSRGRSLAGEAVIIRDRNGFHMHFVMLLQSVT